MRVLRNLANLLSRRRVGAWAAELAGIGLLVVAGWLISPALGLVVLGLYLVIMANTGGE